ncbi:type I-A CRISPR-associated protein Cas5 [Tepidibacillus fermentans]|uniref:Uncharacterized protein n=1 Tax=Tepidibacillus fermentans TaxID=1281767 RepID=A0A4V2URU4_9BACI|nr:type I-A CRISPR-associated protein Cas5 [Tepidibacillus fermentans]TCS78922.1 hypothetical protein EDD72_1241 [Tepidibacillus fermentans]
MWLIATYEHTSLFSLKNTNSTSSGGRTNIVPTMYSIKLALINALYRMGKDGENEFPWVKDLVIRISPPKHAVVNNSFIKILREPKKDKNNPNQKEFISSIAYREFVHFDGLLKIAFNLNMLHSDQIELLKQASIRVRYFGKRGSFVQFKGFEMINEEELSSDFTWILGDERTSFNSHVQFQQLDDIGSNALFQNINTYDETKSKIGKDRLLLPVAVPYLLKSSSRSYTHFVKAE